MNAVFGVDIGFTSALDEMQLQIEAAIQDDSNGLSFSELIKLDETEITKKFGKGVLIMVKAYQEESKKLSDESLMRAAELLNTYKNYEQQRKDIIAKGEQDIADLIANGASTEAIEMVDKATAKALDELQEKILKEYGLSDYAQKGHLSDYFKNRIKESLPLFKNITTATLAELKKAKESINSMKVPPQLLIDFKKAGFDAALLSKVIKEAQENANEALDNRILDKIIISVNKLVNSVGKLGSASQKLDNKNLKGIGEFFEAISGGLGDILDFVKLGKNATTMDVVSLGISGVATIIDTTTTAIQQNIEAQRDWAEALENSLQKMRMYNIEQLAYKESSIFGMDNPIAPAIAAIKQYEKSVESLLEIQKKLGGGLVQTGTGKVPSGSAIAGFVGGGAAIGTAIGSVVPVLGTAIGAVVGGLLGELS